MTGKASAVETANFGFLARHDVHLVRLGAFASCNSCGVRISPLRNNRGPSSRDHSGVGEMTMSESRAISLLHVGNPDIIMLPLRTGGPSRCRSIFDPSPS